MNPLLPGSPEELQRFAEIQQLLPDMFRKNQADPRREQTVVVIPSLSLDERELAKVTGVHHYEERMLFFLMLLRHAQLRLIFVTSEPISPVIVDYYLHLLSGIPASHARSRLMLFHCADGSSKPLTAKILERPRLLSRIAAAVGDTSVAHMVCFNSTGLERTLAVRLGIPLYANDPAKDDLGSKSGCRETFREAGIRFPDGFERLRDAQDIARALTELQSREPGIRKAVVKLNHGFSGEGNALFRYQGVDPTLSAASREQAIRDRLPDLAFEAPAERWPTFEQKFREMQGVVEAWVEGDEKRSPSCQARVNALGQPIAISTHDQLLGGPSGQVFLGATFPADPAYRLEIQAAGMQVAEVLARKGAMGRFATDFVSVRNPGTGAWEHHAIEVNLRKGGTTHPFATLHFLTDGSYDPSTGEFLTQGGTPKAYFASDTLQDERYKGLLPEDLMDIVVYHGLHFHASTERGVVFHLMGALSEFGKLGVVCIGDNLQQARFLYKKTIGVLDQEVGPAPG